MLKPGKRQLRDITDQELRVIVEMSGHYGHKDYCKDRSHNPSFRLCVKMHGNVFLCRYCSIFKACNKGF